MNLHVCSEKYLKNLEISGVLIQTSVVAGKQLHSKHRNLSASDRLQDDQVVRLPRSQGNEDSFHCQTEFTEMSKCVISINCHFLTGQTTLKIS